MPLAEVAISQLADAKGEITLSLQRVLRGCIAEIGGEEAMGVVLGQIIKDEEVAVASKVNLLNNLMKLMGQYGESDNDSDLLDEEQIQARLRMLGEA